VHGESHIHADTLCDSDTHTPKNDTWAYQCVKPRLHQGNMLQQHVAVDGNMLPGNKLLDRSGNMLTVSRQHNYYSFMSRSTCIPLYSATDGQQTGNNFVDGDKQHVDGNMLPGNMLPWCKRGLSLATYRKHVKQQTNVCLLKKMKNIHCVRKTETRALCDKIAASQPN